MDPNTQHQMWSHWTVIATLPLRHSHETDEFFQRLLRTHAAKIRELFGSAGQVRIILRHFMIEGAWVERWTLHARVEGAPVHDSAYRTRMSRDIKDFYQRGFGPQSTIVVQRHLLAGDTQDGKPPEQAVFLPLLGGG